MISKCCGYPVDGSLESGPQGEAQCLVGGVLHAAGRPDGFTGGVRQLEVSIYGLKTAKEQQNETVLGGRTNQTVTVKIVFETHTKQLQLVYNNKKKKVPLAGQACS